MWNPVKKLALDILPKRLILEMKKMHYLRVPSGSQFLTTYVRHGPRRLVNAGDVVFGRWCNFWAYTRLLSEWVSPTLEHS